MTDNDLFSASPVPAIAPVAPSPVAQSLAPSAPAPPSSPASGFDVAGAITSAAQKYGVNPALALAIAHQESGLNPYPHDSSAGAVGPMQLMGPTASDLGVANIRDPAQNIDGGVRYIKQLQDQFGADRPELIAAGYNAGPANAAKHGTNWAAYPDAAQTTPYVTAVTTRLAGGAPGSPAPEGLTPDQQKIWEDLQTPAATTAAGNAPATTKQFTVGQNSAPPTAAQEAYYRQHYPQGGDNIPYALQAGGPLPQTPGAHYVDLDGAEHVVPGGLPEQIAGAARGLFQGAVMDPAASVAKLTSGGIATAGDDPMADALASTQGGASQHDLAQAALAGTAQQQRNYSVENAGNQIAQGGRFVGQAIPATIAAASVPEIEAPSALGGLGRVAASGLTNALRGTAAAATNVGPNSAPVPQQLATGALAGVASPVVLGTPTAIGKAVTGLGRTVSPEVATLADSAAQKYGFTGDAALASGQVMGADGDRNAATAYSNLLGSSQKAAARNAAQRQVWMRGVTGSYGDASGDVGPQALSEAKQRIGGVMNDVASRTNIAPDSADAAQTRIGQIISDAQQVLPDNEVKPLLNIAQNIGDVRNENGISGDSYQALTRQNAPLDRLENSDNSNVAHYASQIHDALNDGLAASSSPEDVSALGQARFQYKNLMTVAKAVKSAAGNLGPDGVLPAGSLQGAVRSQFDNAAFQGAGPLGDLMQIRQTFMKEPANSFTANRLRDLAMPALLGAGAGAAGDTAAFMLAHPEGAIGTLGSAGIGALTKVAADAIKQNRVVGPATGIVARSLPGAPRAGGLSALGGAIQPKPIDIPLSALAAMHFPSFQPSQGPAVVNAQ